MSKSVLVVDDSSMMRKIIVKMLEPEGYKIAGEAASGSEAVKLYQQIKPDVVTMDITMRDMDGITAAKDIMTFDPNAKILFLSNLEGEKYRDEVDRLGGLGMVKKHENEVLEVLSSLA